MQQDKTLRSCMIQSADSTEEENSHNVGGVDVRLLTAFRLRNHSITVDELCAVDTAVTNEGPGSLRGILQSCLLCVPCPHHTVEIQHSCYSSATRFASA